MTIGVLGGGQLGRMLALAGYPLGLTCRFLDPAPDAPAGQVAELIVADYTDAAALHELARGVDAITYEFESVPADSAARLAQRAPVWPPAEALRVAQDRLAEKALFRELGIETADYRAVDGPADLRAAIEHVGLPAVLKTRRLGYDGKGQVVLRDASAAERALEALGGRGLILEAFVPFARELSIVCVRGRDGATAVYPLIENQHAGGILRVSRAPAADVTPALAAESQRIATTLLERLQYVGVLAVELFQVGGRLLGNELAPRVHNSGHWTIEGAVTSQFENHLRAVAGLPLGDAGARGHAAMVNLIGTAPEAARLLAVPGAHVHMYGKAPREGRKLGHVTLCADTSAAVEAGVAALMDLAAGG